jgi:hypothetical protein
MKLEIDKTWKIMNLGLHHVRIAEERMKAQKTNILPNTLVSYPSHAEKESTKERTNRQN